MAITTKKGKYGLPVPDSTPITGPLIAPPVDRTIPSMSIGDIAGFRGKGVLPSAPFDRTKYVAPPPVNPNAPSYSITDITGVQPSTPPVTPPVAPPATTLPTPATPPVAPGPATGVPPAAPIPTATPTTPTYNTDWAAQYGDVLDQLLGSNNAAYQGQVNALNAQLPQIKETYDQQRSTTQSNAMLNAAGNNERLAARGLAGNAYTAPMTGYSETSRVAENNALRGALANAGLAQRGAERDIANQILAAGTTRDVNAGNLSAQIGQAKIGALQNQSQFDANYNLNVAQQAEAVRQFNEQMGTNKTQFDESVRQWNVEQQNQQAAQAEAVRQFNEQMGTNKTQFDESVRQWTIQQEAAAAERTAQQQQQQYQNAFNELQAFGKIVTQAAADALGYPIGTPISKIKGQKKSSSPTTPTVPTTTTPKTFWDIIGSMPAPAPK